MRATRIHSQKSTAESPTTGDTTAPDSRRDSSPCPVHHCDGTPLSGARLAPAWAATGGSVHGAFTDSRYWSPQTARLHRHPDGGINQIVDAPRGPGHSDPSPASRRIRTDVLVDALDAVLTTAPGAVVPVAHTVASLSVQAWITTYPQRARRVAGVVLLNDCVELPRLAGRSSTRQAALRGVPHTGRSLPHAEPAKTAAPILAALEVANRTHRQDRGPC
ncbi:alpha/beta fold hydrolase [Nocardia sp. R7R-8]|uniref:alpha/beta fold hydrolase n=1 Tax=Nocardia sp. R7R-8 TaxID=3459304 RepID=UPI00403DF9D6